MKGLVVFIFNLVIFKEWFCWICFFYIVILFFLEWLLGRRFFFLYVFLCCQCGYVQVVLLYLVFGFVYFRIFGWVYGYSRVGIVVDIVLQIWLKFYLKGIISRYFRQLYVGVMIFNSIRIGFVVVLVTVVDILTVQISLFFDFVIVGFFVGIRFGGLELGSRRMVIRLSLCCRGWGFFQQKLLILVKFVVYGYICVGLRGLFIRVGFVF